MSPSGKPQTGGSGSLARCNQRRASSIFALTMITISITTTGFTCIEPLSLEGPSPSDGGIPATSPADDDSAVDGLSQEMTSIFSVLQDGGAIDVDNDGISDIVIENSGSEKRATIYRNGKVIEIVYYSDEELIRKEIDRNGDSITDYILTSERTDGRQIDTTREDNDYDGVFESQAIRITDGMEVTLTNQVLSAAATGSSTYVTTESTTRRDIDFACPGDTEPSDAGVNSIKSCDPFKYFSTPTEQNTKSVIDGTKIRALMLEGDGFEHMPDGGVLLNDDPSDPLTYRRPVKQFRCDERRRQSIGRAVKKVMNQSFYCLWFINPDFAFTLIDFIRKEPLVYSCRGNCGPNYDGVTTPKTNPPRTIINFDVPTMTDAELWDTVLHEMLHWSQVAWFLHECADGTLKNKLWEGPQVDQIYACGRFCAGAHIAPYPQDTKPAPGNVDRDNIGSSMHLTWDCARCADEQYRAVCGQKEKRPYSDAPCSPDQVCTDSDNKASIPAIHCLGSRPLYCDNTTGPDLDRYPGGVESVCIADPPNDGCPPGTFQGLGRSPGEHHGRDHYCGADYDLLKQNVCQNAPQDWVDALEIIANGRIGAGANNGK